jgi:hypothetical protein
LGAILIIWEGLPLQGLTAIRYTLRYKMLSEVYRGTEISRKRNQGLSEEGRPFSPRGFGTFSWQDFVYKNPQLSMFSYPSGGQGYRQGLTGCSIYARIEDVKYYYYYYYYYYYNPAICSVHASSSGNTSAFSPIPSHYTAVFLQHATQWNFKTINPFRFNLDFR